MAFYILIEKIREDDLSADYRFKGDGEGIGLSRFNKVNGEVLLVQQMQGDEHGHVFNRAAVKIMREWKRGNLPASAEWAS